MHHQIKKGVVVHYNSLRMSDASPWQVMHYQLRKNNYSDASPLRKGVVVHHGFSRVSDASQAREASNALPTKGK
jgi:hypothetical protein